MIDYNRIEEIRLMPVRKASAAMKEYATELGVTIKAKTIDNMVSEMEAQVTAKVDAPVDVPVVIKSNPVVKTTYVDPRIPSVKVTPENVSPILGRQFSLYAKLSGVDNADDVTYSWKKDGVVIQGQTTQRITLVGSATSSGEYECTATPTVGEPLTATATATATVAIPLGFPEINFHHAVWNPFYGAAFSPVEWRALAEAKKILKNSVAHVNFISALSRSAKTFAIYDMLNSAEILVLTDGRDGYPNVIDGNTDSTHPIKEIGRWSI